MCLKYFFCIFSAKSSELLTTDSKTTALTTSVTSLANITTTATSAITITTSGVTIATSTQPSVLSSLTSLSQLVKSPVQESSAGQETSMSNYHPHYEKQNISYVWALLWETTFGTHSCGEEYPENYNHPPPPHTHTHTHKHITITKCICWGECGEGILFSHCQALCPANHLSVSIRRDECILVF